MTIKIIAIGDKLPQWLQQGIDSYCQRFSHPWTLTTEILPPSKRHKSTSTQSIMHDEWLRIKAHIPKQSWVIALDERGKTNTSTEWSNLLEKIHLSHPCLCFILGGADGLAIECKDYCNQQLSLSPMTMPHGLARLVLIEQLYRATSLLRNHPYHRE